MFLGNMENFRNMKGYIEEESPFHVTNSTSVLIDLRYWSTDALRYTKNINDLKEGIQGENLLTQYSQWCDKRFSRTYVPQVHKR